jgi:hypothetical protein
MNEYELNVMCYCCVCLNTLTDDFVKSICCNQMLHKKCLMDWICSSSNISVTCPICRRDIVLNNIIKLEDFVIYINEDLQRYKSINEIKIKETKIKEILSKLYKNDYFITIMNDNSETTKENSSGHERILYYIIIKLLVFLFLFIIFMILSNVDII